MPQPFAFTTTHWSNVLHAGGEDSPTARAALERLCGAYWYPLYAHVRRRGHGPDDASDLTQEFFAELLRRNSLASVGVSCRTEPIHSHEHSHAILKHRLARC